MDITTLWTIIFWFLGALAFLAVLTVWIIILACVWVTATGFFKTYQRSKQVLKDEEERAAREAALSGDNTYLG